jgi:hypothetical protein
VPIRQVTPNTFFSGPVTSITGDFPLRPLNGSCLIVCAQSWVGGGGQTIGTPTDDAGNTYSPLAAQLAFATDCRLRVWACLNAIGVAAHTITVPVSPSANLSAIAIELEGIESIGTAFTNNGTAAASPSSGAVDPGAGVRADYICALAYTGGATAVAISVGGMLQLQEVNEADTIQAGAAAMFDGTGSKNAGWTFDVNCTWGVMGAPFIHAARTPLPSYKRLIHPVQLNLRGRR